MFNFKTIVKSDKLSEPKIFIDSEPYNPKHAYKDLKELVITDKQGEVKIENCRISNLKPNEFAEIKRYSVYFHEKLRKLNQEKQSFFIKTKIQVELFNISQEELKIEELTDYLLSLDAVRKIPEKQSSLVFILNEFKDIDLADFFLEYKKQKNQLIAKQKEQLSSGAKLELNAEKLQMLKQINFGDAAQGGKKFKDENGNENFYPYAAPAENNLVYSNKAAVKTLTKHQQQNSNLFENKILKDMNFQKNKANRDEDAGGFENVFDFSNEFFIPFEEEKEGKGFDFQYNTAANPNPYKLPEKDHIKKHAKSMHIYGLKTTFNQFGEFVTIGNFNSKSHSFALNINKLIPNKSLITDKNLKLAANIAANKTQQQKQKQEEELNKIVNDENISEAHEMSIDDASSRTEDYANAKSYNMNLIGLSISNSAALNSNKTDNNYEDALLQEYQVQTICNFQELLKSKLKYMYKDRNFIEDINKLNINSKILNFNKNGEQQLKGKMDIESHDSRLQHSAAPKKTEIFNQQFLKVLLMNKIDDCLDVADYTKIMWDYLLKLMKAKEKFSQVYKCDSNTEVILNIEKEISTLKLFMSLFLNCFYDLKQLKNISYTNKFGNNISKNFLMLNFSHSNLLETQRLRKKKLLDWLVYDCRNAKFIEEQLNEKEKKIANLEKSEYQNNLYELIFYCLINGRIKKALFLTNSFNLFNLSGLISQFSMNNSLSNVSSFKEHILKEIWDNQNIYLNYIYEILSSERTKLSSLLTNDDRTFARNSVKTCSNESDNAFAVSNTNNANVALGNAGNNSLFGNFASSNQTAGLRVGGLIGSSSGLQQGFNHFANNTARNGLIANPATSSGNLFCQSSGNVNSQANQQQANPQISAQIPSIFSSNLSNNPDATTNPNPNSNSPLNLFYNENILKNLNWKQFFTCNGLYCMKANQNIDEMVENYSAVVKNQGKKYCNIDSYLAQNECQDINMLLLEYYTKIQKNDKYSEEFINQIFLQKNIFSKFSDPHLHFIICTIFINTLTETYSGNNTKSLCNDLLMLKRIQLKLLIKLSEDLLIQGNILAAINLILISNLSNGHKLNLVEEIIYRYIHSDKSGLLISSSTNLKIFEHINSKVTYDSLGLRSLSLFDIEKALKHFRQAENYEKLHEVTNFLTQYKYFQILFYLKNLLI